MKLKTYLTYLKLPEYMIPYIKKRFGNPITFNEGDRFMKLLRSSLVCIEDMSRQYSRISCSQRAYSIAVAKSMGQLSEDTMTGTPAGKDVGLFVPIVMPASIMVHDEELGFRRSVATGPYFTISLAGAQKLRVLIRNLFWTDYARYHKDYSSSGTHKDDVFRFLHTFGIDDDQLENMVRTESRLSKDMI